MDKNKGIWITIACILVIGIFVTLSTSRFVTKQEQSLASTALETSKAASAQKGRSLEQSIAAASSAPVTAAAPEKKDETTAAAAPAPMAAPLTEAETAADDQQAAAAPQAAMAEAGAAPMTLEVVPESETVQSPLKNAKMPEVSLADASQDLGSYYQKRLEELDTQVQKMKDSDSESTTYSMKSNAEKELKLWDNELNVIYNEVLNQCDEEEGKQLVEEERQWMKMRDSAALEASQKYSGGTMEGLEYTATLASYTRDRAYDLVNTYLIKETP